MTTTPTTYSNDPSPPTIGEIWLWDNRIYVLFLKQSGIDEPYKTFNMSEGKYETAYYHEHNKDMWRKVL